MYSSIICNWCCHVPLCSSIYDYNNDQYDAHTNVIYFNLLSSWKKKLAEWVQWYDICIQLKGQQQVMQHVPDGYYAQILPRLFQSSKGNNSGKTSGSTTHFWKSTKYKCLSWRRGASWAMKSRTNSTWKWIDESGWRFKFSDNQTFGSIPLQKFTDETIH